MGTILEEDTVSLAYWNTCYKYLGPRENPPNFLSHSQAAFFMEGVMLFTSSLGPWKEPKPKPKLGRTYNYAVTILTFQPFIDTTAFHRYLFIENHWLCHVYMNTLHTASSTHNQNRNFKLFLSVYLFISFCIKLIQYLSYIVVFRKDLCRKIEV